MKGDMEPMLNKTKVNADAVEHQLVEMMMGMLKNIYSNKSSDEYKSSGDITKTSEYEKIEKMIADLPTLKKYPKNEANDLKTMFNTLHRPIFKQMVTEYIAEPNERNTIFTALYTTGYRVLVGELSRIYASTEATDKGLEYKPDKISRSQNMTKFIKVFNNNLEARIDEYIRSAKRTETVQEGVVDVVAGAGKAVVNFIPVALKAFNNFFHAAKEVNPISLMNVILSSSYNKKVAELDNVAAMYEATKEAYDEYMRIPEAQRKNKIESRYVKLIEKYNIKMKNISAKLAHYDQRAIENTKDATEQASSKPSQNSNTVSDTSSGDPSGNEDTGGFDF